MELNEIIAPPAVHETASDKCPFCPKEVLGPYTSHPGEDNDSVVLTAVMEKPPRLVERQSAARPKEGAEQQQGKSEAQPYPAPPFTHPKHGPYSYEAHHLISGKQALEGHAFERWIVANGTIERDTGYSINNADNGIWAPSIPEKFKDGLWGPMDPETKLAIARIPMENGPKIQFHKSHHAISDPADPDGIKHKTYNGYIKGVLKDMDSRMVAWTQACFLCKPQEKPQPSVRANQSLDNLSRHMKGKISGPPSKWDVFLSKYALWVHEPVCGHSRQGM